jgi:hypothetical protein
VNNAVARAAGLLAVAVVPVAAGIGGGDYTDPAAFSAGFRTAMLLCAVLLAAGGLLGLLLVRRPPERAAGEPASAEDRVPVERCAHCGVSGPQLHPHGSR